jgi:hypothetical protein
MAVFLVGPQVQGGKAAAGPQPRERPEKEPAHIIEGQLLSVSAARWSPTRAFPSPPTFPASDTTNDVDPAEPTEVHQHSVHELYDVAEQTAVITRVHSPLARAANGWKMADFILDPTDATWRAMREHVRHVARPGTFAVIEAVVAAARRQWHSGLVPLKKDGFVADILASPELLALGTMAPRMDVVRKVLDGKHPTLIRAARIQRSA